MKVTLINNLYPPNIVGGAELSTAILASALTRQGLAVSVITLANQRRASQDRVDGITVYRRPLRNLYWPFEGTAPAFLKPAWHGLDIVNRAAMKDVAEIIALERPDIVHTANLAGFSVAAWQAAERAGVPVIHTIRDYYLLCPRSTMFKHARNCEGTCAECRLFTGPRKRNSRIPTGVVGVSRFALRRHLDLGYFGAARVKRVIFNAFPDASEPAPSKARSDGVVRFGYLGRLHPSKGLDLLLASLKTMPAEGWRLIIAGTGSEAYLQELGPSLDSPRVDYLGWMDPAAFFSRIDVLAVPSLWHEPLPRTVIEAYGYGIPVIASQRGGIPEIVEAGTTGWLFDPDEAGGLARALGKVIQCQATLPRMRQACLDKAQEFRPETIAKQYIGAYTDVLAAEREGSGAQ